MARGRIGQARRRCHRRFELFYEGRLRFGVIAAEMKAGASDATSRKSVDDFYRQAITADSIVRAIALAIEQPADVNVNQIVVRPTVQEF